jgi:glycosyltransferase involved in cell wall biosynthesis
MPIDITLILNVHREHALLTRTLRSLEEAATYAQQQKISLELLIVLDRTDAPTRELVSRARPLGFDDVRVIEVDNGSLGPSRNSGAAQAMGEWLFLQDADDLLSFNALAGLYQSAMRWGPRSIHICDTLVSFGEACHVASYLDSDVVSPIALVDTHPYVSRILCHRTLIEAQPFSDLRLTRGYAYEDWLFNSNALASGYSIRVAENTVFFYRQRLDGLMRQATAISTRQIPPSLLFQPTTFLQLAANGYARFRENPNLRDDYLPELSPIHHPVIFEHILAANRIEPQIDWQRLVAAQWYTNLHFGDVRIGVAYYEICRIVATRTFDDVFLLPFFSAGGGERYLLNVIEALNQAGTPGNILMFLGQDGYVSDWVDRLPANVIVIDLSLLASSIGQEGRSLLVLKTIEAVASTARLHLKPCQFAHAFAERYLRLLQECTRIYYRFTDARHYVNGREVVDPNGFEFVSTWIEDIDLVIADNQLIIEEDRWRLGVYPERWHLLPARQSARVTHAEIARLVESANPVVAWASRLDQQKRPQLLPLIAERLWQRLPDVQLHIFGKAVLDRFDPEAFARMPNVQMHGEFSQFEEVLAVRPMCFAFTSFFEGLPIVLLETAASGVPIVAPDVGGISELVTDRATGILLPSLADDHCMADAMVDAIIALWADPPLRQRLAERALVHLATQHGGDTFQRRVESIFLECNHG